MKRKFLAIALAAFMVLGLMPGLTQTASAAGTVHTVAAWDDPVLDSGMPGVDSGDTLVLPEVAAADTVLSVPAGITALTVQGRAVYTNLSIVLDTGHPGLTLTIQDLSMAASSGIDLSGASASSLLLAGSNTIGSRIVVPEGMTLTIDGSGSLTANAGIGGGHDYTENDGTIVINSGTITAQGEEGTAGIGGGYGPYRGPDVIIWGGTITATGGDDGSGGHGGAGIGGGSGTGNPGTVTIHGGTIIAHGGARAAGIGGGRGCGSGGIVTIYGGDITATGGDDGANDKGGAGIGNPHASGDSTVAIYGGTIRAYGGANAAGIGAGCSSKAVDIAIADATIIAVGGTGIEEFNGSPSASGGAGIGGAVASGNGSCSISNSTVTAQGGYGSAGIGSGFKSIGMPLTVSNSTITATGGENGAGIGSGILGGGVDLSVSSGRIIATGGTNAQDIGASLLSQGGGHGGSGSLTVTGWVLITADDTISPTGSNGPYTINLFTAPSVPAGVEAVTVAADDSSFSFTQNTGTDGTLGGIYLVPDTDVLISVAGYDVKTASDTSFGPSVNFNSGSAAIALDIYLSSTSGDTAPSVTTNAASGVTASGATLNGNVTSDGGATVTARGFVYGASANPAIGGTGVTQAASGSGTGAFTAALSGLAASTPYHVRAYAINSEGTSYGDDVTFTTLSAAIHYDTEDGGEVVIGTEAAWSGAPSNIKGTLFWTGSTWVSNDTVAHMYFTDLLGARLMDYTDVAIPAAAETSTQNGIGFVAEEYSYQAAAADGSGTYQYTGMKYTVTQADGKKIILLSRGLGRGTGVSYLEVFMENQTSGTLAIRHGSVLYGSAGTAAEAAALDNPATGVMGLLRTADVYWFDRDGGSDMGGFTLSPHTDVRPASLVVVSHPLLTNQVVRFDLMFMSSENALYRYMLSPSLTSETFIPTTTPTVATNAASGVTASGATLNGNVTSDGGATVTARGFVYGSAADPAIGGAGVIQAAAGTGTGAFTANISGLAASTTYHVRAYAINSEGTAYGTDRTFTTQSGGGGGPTTEKPTVITNTVTGVTASSATLSGNVTASGGATVTARGFVYGSAADPAIGGTGVTQTAAGTGTGSFTANVSGLTASTTYHVRAYATNSEGTSYGADVSFTTSAATTPTTPPDDNDPDYISRTLTDNATGITVSGSLIHRNAALTVNALALHAEGTCAACDEIRQRMADDDFLLLVGKDISLSYGFQGSLTITIPVGSAYNGDTVTILHCANGTLQTFTATVKDGKATFTVTSLSPFAVFTATDVLDNIPKTGDGGGFPLGLGLSALGVLGFCLLVLTRKRRRA